MRLFIIGNGFDIDHGAKSKFSDFKEYLEQTYISNFNRYYPAYPSTGLAPDGDLVVDPISSSQILYCLICDVSSENNWCDFEECLGFLDYHTILEMVEYDDEEPSHYYHNLEDVVRDLDLSLNYSVSGIFCEWIEQIDYTLIKPKYAFNGLDIFLTFNYTSVLEDIYGINPINICHIHGSLSEGKCVVGHNNNEREFNDYDEFISFNISQIHDRLIKNTEQLYLKNISFFKKVYSLDITEIVFFGFSLNDVDTYYIKCIFENIETNNVQIFFSEYEVKHGSKEKERVLRRLGFKGQFCGFFKQIYNK